MTTEHMEALVAYRLAQADDALRSAEVLLQSELLRDAVNRAYYAMFYVILALLTTRNLGSSKHHGVIALFDREFVKTGQVPRDLSRWLHRAFERRLEADYSESPAITLEDASRTVEEARLFVRSLRQRLQTAAS